MSLTPEDFAELERAFDSIVDAPSGQREGLLAAFAASKPSLLPRLQAMLQAEAREDDPLRALVDEALPAEAAAEEPYTEGPKWIGPFRVMGQLGRGGMGVVHLCCREVDGFQQWVAVKHLPLANSGLGRSRLKLERRVLARLRHPHIAQLIDGGEDALGAPFVAMEYVEGESILRHARDNGLGTLARVRLFLQLCSAVSFAHAHLVIHRDIKPENVLVDRHGQVKLLDFGIAKLLDEQAVEGAGEATVAGAMTPHYASPEQARGDPVSQASDQYSLGVLLYELLTGERPYRIITQRPSEIERIICQTPAPPPSVCLRERLQAPRDLDAVVLKALNKQPERRYASVAQFAEDLENWLTRRPVRARPDSRGYRLLSFVRRHPAEVASAALTIIALLGFSLLLAWQSERIRIERDVASREARISEETVAFLLDTFSHANPREARGTEPRVRDLLDYAAERLPGSLEDDPLAKARLLHAIGTAYVNLGVDQRSRDLLEQALALRETHAGANSLAVAETLNRLGNAHRQFGRFAKAEAALLRALALREANGPADAELADSYNNVGLLQVDMGRLDEAEAHLKRSITLHQQVARQAGRSEVLASSPMHNLALALRARGDLQAARQMAAQSVALKRGGEAGAASLANSLAVQASIESALGLHELALAHAAESLALRRGSLGNSSPMLARGLLNHAQVLEAAGHVDAAAALFDELAALHREHDPDSLQSARSALAHGQFLAVHGDSSLARATLQRARTLAAKHLPADSPQWREFETAADP